LSHLIESLRILHSLRVINICSNYNLLVLNSHRSGATNINWNEVEKSIGEVLL
jgi:hypothetical protein